MSTWNHEADISIFLGSRPFSAPKLINNPSNLLLFFVWIRWYEHLYYLIFCLVDLFGIVLTILEWTKWRLVTKHALSSTHLPFLCFLLTFSLKYYLYKKFELYNRDYSLLIYTFVSMIIFLRSIHLNFQSHQMCTFSAGLVMARNWDGMSWRTCFYEYL